MNSDMSGSMGGGGLLLGISHATGSNRQSSGTLLSNSSLSIFPQFPSNPNPSPDPIGGGGGCNTEYVNGILFVHFIEL